MGKDQKNGEGGRVGIKGKPNLYVLYSGLILYLKKTSLPISYEGHVIYSTYGEKDSRNTC